MPAPIIDVKQYKKTAVAESNKKPLKTQIEQATRQLNEDENSTSYQLLDLEYFFAVPEDKSPENLKQWEVQLISVFNKNERLCKTLSSLFDLVKKQTQGAMLTESFWNKLGESRHEAERDSVNAAVASVAGEYASIGAVTLEQLARRIEALGISHPAASILRSAAKDAGIRLVQTVELPEGKLPGNLATLWRRAEKTGKYGSIFDLLFYAAPAAKWTVKVVENFEINGSPVRSAMLEKSLARLSTASAESGITEGKDFLTELLKCASAPQALRECILLILKNSIEEERSNQQPWEAIQKRLQRFGLEPTDAQSLTVAVAAQETGGQHKPLASGEIREALEHGDLATAKRLADSHRSASNDKDPDLKAAISDADTLFAARDGHRAAYESALRGHNYPAARQALDEWSRIESLENVDVLYSKIPPAQPLDVQVSTTSAGVVTVTWTPSREENQRFLVIRSSTPSVHAPTDGTAVGQPTTATRIEDTQPLHGTTVYYAVFSVRENGLNSEPQVSRPCTVLPAPTDVTCTAGTTSVTISWTRPAGASLVKVDVSGPSGFETTRSATTSTSLSIDGLRTGEHYQIAVSAGYSSNGQELLSQPYFTEAIPRGIATAVTDFQVTAGNGAQSQQTFEAEWHHVPGFAVEIWALPHDTAERSNDTVQPMVLTASGGTRLASLGPIIRENGRSRGTFAVPSGISKIIAMLVTDNGLLPGASRVVGNIPSVSDVDAELLGDKLRLSFVWPHGNYKVRVQWHADSHEQQKIASKVDYTREGGIFLPAAPGLSDITLTTMAYVDGQEVQSSPVTVPFESPLGTESRTVNYQLSTKKSLFGGKYTVKVSASGEPSPQPLSAVLMMKYGPIMPYDDSDGVEVSRFTLDLSQATGEAEIDLGKVRAPFWVFAVSTDPTVTLAHPHSQQQKVEK